MTDLFTIKGTQAAIERIFHEIENDQTISGDPGISIKSINPVYDTSVLRKPLGLEPLVYFVVAYSAHLAADVTLDMIRAWLKDRVGKSPSNISIEETKDSETIDKQ